MKLKWKVGDKPTGQYRSFFNRSWPDATYKGTESYAGKLVSVNDTSYEPRLAETEELYVYLADYSEGPAWTLRRLKKRAIGVKQGKQMLQDFLDQHPEYWPSSLR